jgi:hypothetical protein
MKGEGLSKKRPLEVADIAGGRREKRQKMGRSKEDEAKRAARKLIEKRLREDEADLAGLVSNDCVYAFKSR